MSYTEIGDKPAAAPVAAPPPPSASYTSTAPTYDAGGPVSHVESGTRNAAGGSQSRFGPSAFAANLSKLIGMIGVGIVGLGLLIALCSYAAKSVAFPLLEMLCIVGPCVLLLLSLLPSTPSREHLIVVVIVFALTASIWAFFDFIVLAKTGKGDAALSAAASGLFFIFLGEAVVTASGFLLQTNIL